MRGKRINKRMDEEVGRGVSERVGKSIIIVY